MMIMMMKNGIQINQKKKNKKDLDTYYTNDSTSCVSVPCIPGKDVAAVPSFVGYTTPQQPTYDINNFNDTPMGNTMGNTIGNTIGNPMDYNNDIDTQMDNNSLLIPPNIMNMDTFDSITNTLNTTTFGDNWSFGDTPNPHPINRYPSIDSLNNNQFNFDPNIIPFNNYITNDINLDLIENNIDTYTPPFIDHSNIHNTNNNTNNNEVAALRQQNELLLRRVEQQQRQIEYLASQIGAIHSTNQNYNDSYVPQPHNPLKRRRITPEALLPPAA
eukprot:753399_1